MFVSRCKRCARCSPYILLLCPFFTCCVSAPLFLEVKYSVAFIFRCGQKKSVEPMSFGSPDARQDLWGSVALPSMRQFRGAPRAPCTTSRGSTRRGCIFGRGTTAAASAAAVAVALELCCGVLRKGAIAFVISDGVFSRVACCRFSMSLGFFPQLHMIPPPRGRGPLITLRTGASGG